jgi:predicted nucleotidyltransferase
MYSSVYLNMKIQSNQINIKIKIQLYLQAMEIIAEDLKEYYPKTVLLFGSLARGLSGEKLVRPPNDIDLLIVCNSRPFKIEKKDYGVAVELHRLKVDQMVGISKSLRYDTKATALFKLYSKNVVKQHSIDVIAASLLLGPTYNDFGIEQIEVDGIIDKRDYSIHKVLSGQDWWNRLRTYALERRGPWKRFTDRMVGNEEFIP